MSPARVELSAARVLTSLTAGLWTAARCSSVPGRDDAGRGGGEQSPCPRLSPPARALGCSGHGLYRRTGPSPLGLLPLDGISGCCLWTERRGQATFPVSASAPHPRGKDSRLKHSTSGPLKWARRPDFGVLVLVCVLVPGTSSTWILFSYRNENGLRDSVGVTELFSQSQPPRHVPARLSSQKMHSPGIFSRVGATELSFTRVCRANPFVQRENNSLGEEFHFLFSLFHIEVCLK